MHSLLAIAHNGVLIAIIAHGLIGISLVWDKVLLRRPETKNLVSYVFWLGFISVFGLALIPFGFHMPSWGVAGLGAATGALHMVAIYFYYAALKAGEASQTLAIMGGFSPVATALVAIGLLHNQLGGATLLAFALLTASGFVMFFSEHINLRKVLPRVILASGFYGLVNVLQKLVFDQTNFVSGYVFFTIGTFLGALALLARAKWRRQIFETSENAEPRNRFWYFVNRFMSGVGSFLIFYAISLMNPALVDSITGIRYVIIFVGALALTRMRPQWLSEDFSALAIVGKAVATALVVAGLVILGRSGGESGQPSQLRSPRTVVAVVVPPVRRVPVDSWP